MKEKKNIDGFFEENLNKNAASPSPRVWENIEAQLRKEKKDRRVVPLWIKLGGVAALLALLLTVGNFVFNSSEISSPSITGNDSLENEKSSKNEDKIIENASNETKIATENALNRSGKEADYSSTTSSSKGAAENNPNAISHKNNIKNSISLRNSENETSENSTRNHFSHKNSDSERIAANIYVYENPHLDNKIDKESSVLDEKEDDLNKDQNGDIVDRNLINENADSAVASETENVSQKKSILDAIAEQNRKDEIIEEQQPENRWNIAPSVAPVYYSSLGSGSSIDPKLSENPKSGDVNVSYGVQIGYVINDRLSIRSGVSYMDLSYSTKGIELGTAPASAALRSVAYNSSGTVITAVDKGSFSRNDNGEYKDVKLKSTAGDVKLIQNINYYEVPLELKYAVFNTKLGINLIGGFSTLFLGNDEISVRADDYNSVLGEANNLSSVSFSTNVGLGLDYKISKKFTFNVEPMFKYQLNPYTDSSVNFKPYYLGVYSGLSFKF